MVSQETSQQLPTLESDHLDQLDQMEPDEILVIKGRETWDKKDHTVDRHIVVAPGGCLTIRQSTIRFARLEDLASFPIQGFKQPNVWVVPGGEFIAERSHLTVPEGQAPGAVAFMADGAPITIGACKLRNLNTIATHRGGHLQFTHNDVTGFTSTIGPRSVATGEIAYNHFRDQPRAATSHDSTTHIHHNKFERIEHGVVVHDATLVASPQPPRPLVEANEFFECPVGFFARSGHRPIARNNIFEACEIGARVQFPPEAGALGALEAATLLGNRFLNNTQDIFVSSLPAENEADGLTCHVHENRFEGACVNIRTEGKQNAPFHVDATRNYWGPLAGGAECRRVIMDGATVDT